MGHHDIAVPLRFLALLGHFFAALLTINAMVRPMPGPTNRGARSRPSEPDGPPEKTRALAASRSVRPRDRSPRGLLVRISLIPPQRDNVIVALPFYYQQSQLDERMNSARAAMILCFCILAVNAFTFFGGFSTFDLPASIFRACSAATLPASFPLLPRLSDMLCHRPCRRPCNPPAVACVVASPCARARAAPHCAVCCLAAQT